MVSSGGGSAQGEGFGWWSAAEAVRPRVRALAGVSVGARARYGS